MAKRLLQIHASLTDQKCVYYMESFPLCKEGVYALSKGKLEVPVLDATAITVSILRQDCQTTGSVMFRLVWVKSLRMDT